MGFLMPLDLAFASWFFYLFGKAQKIGISMMGLQLHPRFPYFIEQSFGAVVTLPTGSEESGQSFDAMRSKLFMAMRYYFSSFVLSAHAGVRVNESGTWYGVPLDGQTAGTLAAAAIYPFGTKFTIIGEFSYEGERFAGWGADTRLLAGVNWKPAHFGTFRFSIGAGLSDGAPDTQFLGAWAFDF